MITFFTLGHQGRLGNQLFQYAALRSLGLSNGYVVKIPDPKTRIWHGQTCLLDRFNIPCEYFTDDDVKSLKYEYSEPDYMKFDSRFFDIPDDTNIDGFFQSTYYFYKFKDQIKKELTPKQNFVDQASSIMNGIRESNKDYKIVSLHLRRGDNSDWTDPNQVLLNHVYGKGKELDKDSFYYKYLSKAMGYFENIPVKYMVFTGGSRKAGNSNSEDVEWCKRNFKGDNFIFSNTNDSILDYILIGMCDHNILSHITSFGWWAAYVGYNPDKKMIAPLYYHPDIPGFTSRDGYFTDEFILV